MAMSETWYLGWQHLAACRGQDGLFFAEDSAEERGERRAREASAKAICARCPVRTDCLEYALRTREPYGLWGGLNEYERRVVLRERAREERAAS